MRRIAAIAVVLVGALVAVGAGATSSSSKTPTYLVRAIFDNAGFAVSGEDVRIAGAPVGSIQGLDVTKQNKAAVTLAITNPAFTPFHQNATCAIRPQSLIGERYVDCFPGSSSTPALTKITHGPGSGSYYLPLARTSSPIDADIVQDIYQLPIRERFALILNELGTGLAARGSDLNAVIHRADPALGDTDKVVQILAKQNRQLAQLSTDSNRVLAPLAQVKHAIADFVVQANTTAKASASRAPDISRSINEFPPLLYPSFVEEFVLLGRTKRFNGDLQPGILHHIENAQERRLAGSMVQEGSNVHSGIDRYPVDLLDDHSSIE